MGPFFAGALVLVSVGCATSTDSIEDPAAAYETLEEFCQARAAAECSPAVVNACESGSATTCAELRESACLASAPQGTSYVAKNAKACVELTREVYAKAALSSAEVGLLAHACLDDLFSGPGEAREPCTTSLDCNTAVGLECRLPSPLAPGMPATGKCLVPNLVASGESCAGEADRCQTGLFCATSTRVCMPAVGVNQVCEAGVEGACVAGSVCKGGAGPIEPPRCFALEPAGAHCTDDAECADGLCDRLAANGNGSCTATLQLVSIAASCQGFHP